MANNEPAELLPSQDDDGRLELFLEKAAPILTVERGLNAKSRVKLAALARDVGLPDDQFEEAVGALQGGPSQAAASTDPMFDAFCLFLHARLTKLPRNILTSEIETRAVLIAKRNYQLTEPQARNAIRQVASARKLMRISREEAQRHVAEMVAEKIGDSAWVDKDSTERLRSAGGKWGLDTKQVDAIIRRHTQENHRRQKRDQWVTAAALAVGATVALALVVFLFTVMMRGDSPTAGGGDGNTDTAVSPGGDVRSPPPPTIGPPPWWDTDLSIAVNRARVNIASLAPIYPRMASAEGADRAAAYRELAQLCRQDGIETLQMILLSEVLAACYALEEDDDSAAALRDALLQLARSEPGRLPEDPFDYRNAYWAIAVCLDAMRHEDLPEQRGDLLLAAMQRTLAAEIDRNVAGGELDARCFSALTRSLYQQLRLGASKQPYLASQLQRELSIFAEQWLAREEIERLDADFLVAALPAAGDGWREYAELIKDAVFSTDSLNTLKTIKLYEQTSDSALQNFLGELLLLRFGLPVEADTVAETAAVFRDALGVTPAPVAVTARDRWRTLRSEVDAARGNWPAASQDHATRLGQAVEVAHFATLAVVVAQQDPGFPLFDELLKQGPPQLSDSASDEGGPAGVFDRTSGTGRSLLPPTKLQRDDLKRHIEGLRRRDTLRRSQRLTHLRGLALLTGRFEEIEPDQGAVIVQYLLDPKTPQEQTSLVDSAQKVARWKYVRLALADGVIGTKLPKDQLSPLLSEVLRREIDLDDGVTSRETIRRWLLGDVLMELTSTATPASAVDAGPNFDRAAEAFHQLYRTRAKVLGVAPAQYNASTSPAQALELLTTRAATVLSGATLKDADRRLLTDLPHEMAVIDYLGADDLRRTVLLQRLWLRLVSIDVGRKRSDRLAQATALLDELYQRDAKADDLVVQLRDGEDVSLEMWMLLAP